jgi:GNAT superfamily N-acetyltransferase
VTGSGTVRPAVSDEAARCAELLADARRAFGEQRGGALLERFGADGSAVSGGTSDLELVSSRIGHRDRTVLVGEAEGRVIAVASAEVTGEGADRFGRILYCYVEPGARRHGMGGSLMEALLAWFADAGCVGIDASALPGDRAAKQLYERAGFKARLLILHRPQE